MSGARSKVFSSAAHEVGNIEEIELGTKTAISSTVTPIEPRHKRGGSNFNWQTQGQGHNGTHNGELALAGDIARNQPINPMVIQTETTIEVRDELILDSDVIVKPNKAEQTQGFASRSASLNSGSSEKELYVSREKVWTTLGSEKKLRNN